MQLIVNETEAREVIIQGKIYTFHGLIIVK